MAYEPSSERKLDKELDLVADLIAERVLLRESQMCVFRHRVVYQSRNQEPGVLSDYSLTDETRAKISELIEQDVKQQIDTLEKSLVERGVRV